MIREPDFRDDAPWKQRFRAPSIAWASIAENNPARGVVCTNMHGVYQLYAWDVKTGSLKQLTHQPAGLFLGYIAADGRFVYYHHDEQGNEIGHFRRVPFEGGETTDITPDLSPYASFGITDSRLNNLIGFTAADKEGFKVYVLKGESQPQIIYRSARLVSVPALSSGGELVVAASSERSGTLDTSLLAFDLETGAQIAELWDGDYSSIGLGPFSPVSGDFRLLGTTSISGYNRPLIWNPRMAERVDLAIDDLLGEVVPWAWSPNARRVLLRQLHKAQYQLYVYDVERAAATRLNHPAGVLGGFGNGYFTNDGEIFVTWEDSVHPSSLIALDGAMREQKRSVLEAGTAPGGRKWQSATFTSTDGAQIQGWLATPEGQGPFPTVLHTHGGPTWSISEVFLPESQAWLDHGFAFCTINYHGSTTFGKEFEKSIWGNLGHLEVDDMAAAFRWLVDSGIARPDTMLLTGTSYGGYLTLQAIGKRPDLWAGGMAQMAIADWKLTYEDQVDTLRGYQRALFRGTPDETPEATRASSPITYAEHIKAPLLVIQGRNDTRCPARQMEAYEQQLKSLGKRVTVHWFDAGHGSRVTEQQIEHQELMLRFAYQVVG